MRYSLDIRYWNEMFCLCMQNKLQSFTKHLRLARFRTNDTLPEKFNFYFPRVFC